MKTEECNKRVNEGIREGRECSFDEAHCDLVYTIVEFSLLILAYI